MGRPRVYAWPESRRCRKNPDCMTIDGHYGRCILPTARTREAIAGDRRLQIALAARTKQLGLFGKD